MTTSRRFADAIVAGDVASLALLIDRLRNDDGRIARALRLSKRGRPRVDQDRDRVIVELRRRFWSKVSDAEAARAIATAWRRYEASAWRNDQAAGCNPYDGCTPRGMFWALLRAGHDAPSAATIRRRLAAAQKRPDFLSSGIGHDLGTQTEDPTR